MENAIKSFWHVYRDYTHRSIGPGTLCNQVQEVKLTGEAKSAPAEAVLGGVDGIVGWKEVYQLILDNLKRPYS